MRIGFLSIFFHIPIELAYCTRFLARISHIDLFEAERKTRREILLEWIDKLTPSEQMVRYYY